LSIYFNRIKLSFLNIFISIVAFQSKHFPFLVKLKCYIFNTLIFVIIGCFSNINFGIIY